MIGILDYGAGNFGSIVNMFKKIGYSSKIVSSPLELKDVRKIILPGVGAFDHGMSLLTQRGFLEILRYKVIEEKCPVLGICLGAQLLGKGSEEGRLEGLGFIDMEVLRFPSDLGLRIPHMGWNIVFPTKKDSIFVQTAEELRFYFLHSYYMQCSKTENELATTEYGQTFSSAVQSDNIIGVQFHPEKSHRFGADLLKSFLELYENREELTASSD